jgi:hypothetical protein
MYYRTGSLAALRIDLAAAGFTMPSITPLPTLGRRDDGSPRYGLVLARRRDDA